jgi:hypothetical protein
MENRDKPVLKSTDPEKEQGHEFGTENGKLTPFKD